MTVVTWLLTPTYRGAPPALLRGVALLVVAVLAMGAVEAASEPPPPKNLKALARAVSGLEFKGKYALAADVFSLTPGAGELSLGVVTTQGYDIVLALTTDSPVDIPAGCRVRIVKAVPAPENSLLLTLHTLVIPLTPPKVREIRRSLSPAALEWADTFIREGKPAVACEEPADASAEVVRKLGNRTRRQSYVTFRFSEAELADGRDSFCKAWPHLFEGDCPLLKKRR